MKSSTSPPTAKFDLEAFHRLIPSRFSGNGTVLADLADSDKMLGDLVLFEGATNDRILGERKGESGKG